MDVITTNEFTLHQHDLNNNLFSIYFNCYSEPLIKSITKTKTLLGSTVTDNFKTLTFKATSIKTFKQYQEDLYKINGTKNMRINDVAKLTYDLSNQLKFLITYFNKSFIGYNPDDIFVINDNKFICLSNEKLSDIIENNILISYPFTRDDFFLSPELENVKKIPSFINYKSCYFSFACLLIYSLTGNKEFYFNDENISTTQKINNCIDSLPISGSKIFWLLKRCLTEDIEKRSILFL